jgi:hypothetical protein
MSTRNGKHRHGKSWTREEARQRIAEALRHAMEEADMSVEAVSRRPKKAPRTISYWRAGQTPMELESVAMSGKLRRAFIRCFADIDRKTWKAA